MTKEDLRRELLARRHSIDIDARRRYDAALAAQVLAWWDRHPVHSLGVYWPIRGEPNLHNAYAELARHGVQLSLPVVEQTAAPLKFAQWTPGAPMEKGVMNVPIPARPFVADHPEALLIPCLGFTAQRIRLGYGGGFYDRTLAVAPRPLAIGIAYSNALTIFPVEEHDIALDAMITETTVLTETSA